MSQSPRRRVSAVVRAVAGLAAGASLAGCVGHEQVVGLNWAGPPETPRGQEFTPEEAQKRDIAGWVMLRCISGEGHTATHCSVMAETPPGWGFGASALRTTSAMKIQDVSVYGGHIPAVGESFQLPIFFCPPRRMPGCQMELRQQVVAFNVKLEQVSRAVRENDCAGAVRLADEMAIPDLTAAVRARCVGRPAPKG
jgi:hypothetical protein